MADKIEMTEAERRKVREKYRELIVLSEENRDSSAFHDAKKLKEILASANELQEQVTKPREYAADTELLSSLAASGLSNAKRSLVAGKRLNTAKDLMNALKCGYLKGWAPGVSSADQTLADFSWAGLGSFAGSYFNASAGATTMFGPFQDMVPAKARQASRRREREKLGELVNPDELEDAQACCSEQQETDKNMEEMLNILISPDRADGCPFPELVLNPRCFAQTVENIFTLSFLVKDGRVKLVNNPDPNRKGGILVIAVRKRTSPEDNHSAAGEGGQVQFVSAYSMRIWKQMKATVPAEKCLMSHRVHEDETFGITVPDSLPSSPAKPKMIKYTKPMTPTQSGVRRKRASLADFTIGKKILILS